MSKSLTVLAVAGITSSLAGVALAQDPNAGASAGASLSTSDGASADASAAAAPPAEPVAVAPAAPQEAQEPYQPYEDGFPPEGNVLEIGVFGGIILPSKDHNWRYEVYPQKEYEVGPEAGIRFGYYPASFLGLEGEGMAAASTVKGTNNQGVLYAYKAQIVLQAPTPYIAPFLVGGFGRLGGVSHAMGNDVDEAWHFGIGAKIPVTHALSIRLDLRDNLTAKTGGSGQAHTFEGQLGFSTIIERERKPVPPPPLDSDHDSVPDASDKCPTVAGSGADGCPPDTDADGVVDTEDFCPREAGPAPKGCPIVDLDPDKDGVLLPCDQCPQEAGVQPTGCPIRDTDKDGIFDDKDKCPNEPETKNGFEDSDGCPDKVPAAVTKFSGVVQGIFFQKAKATIQPGSKRVLDQAVKVLTDYPSVSIEISGHTSSEGDPTVNQQLSQDRADSVRAYLVERGIDAKRVKTRGVGSEEPIADNKTNAGREKNRRIEFKVLQ